jgi:hypothetical protein
MAPATKSRAAAKITRRRPNRSDKVPAAAAPIAAPASTMATTMPCMVGERASASRIKSSAPEITPVS